MIEATTSTFRPIPFERLKFSGGEMHVRLTETPHLQSGDYIRIRANLFCSDDIFEFMLLVDALRRVYGDKEIWALIPYLPYARQDRVCAPGEALSLKVMCDIINSLNLSHVTVWDAHSDVATALLNKVVNLPPAFFLNFVPVVKASTVLVSPDAGAMKKVGAAAKGLQMPMVRADKTRNPLTGEITGTTVYSEHIGDKNFLIVDDICDGGRTFIELAKVLKPLTNGRVDLYVTHGIFSKGFTEFVGLIDNIYIANPFGKFVAGVDVLATGRSVEIHIIGTQGS